MIVQKDTTGTNKFIKYLYQHNTNEHLLSNTIL